MGLELDAQADRDGINRTVEFNRLNKTLKGFVTEVVVQIFEARTHLLRDRIFEPAASHPADVRASAARNKNDTCSRVPNRVVRPLEAHPTRSVEECWPYGDTKTATHGAEKVILMLATERRVGAQTAAIDPTECGTAFDPKDEAAQLPIVAKMEAAYDPITGLIGPRVVDRSE